MGLAVFYVAAGHAFAAEPLFFSPLNNARDRLFNDGWLFHRGDVKGADAVAFDDSNWQAVELPHDWSMDPVPKEFYEKLPVLSPLKGKWLYRDGNDDAYAAINANLSDWKSASLPGLMDDFQPKSYRWFRTEIVVPADVAAKGATIELGRIDDCDELFVNGEKIGETGVMPKNQPQGNCIPARDNERNYRVPTSALKPGKNVIAICVYNDAAKGGFLPENTKKAKGVMSALEVAGPFLSTAIGGTASGYTVGGTGWYRKHFDWKTGDRQATILFDGVMMNSEVWLNGHLLGFHPYGYTPFYYDLTPYLKDGANTLALRARNEGVTSRWYPGSGIYRNVWLISTGATHIRPWGLWARTISADAKQATLEVDVEVDGPTVGTVAKVSLIGPDGKVAAEGQAALKGAKTTVSLVVKNPQLWNLETPSMYSAHTELVQQDKIVDSFDQAFGIRIIRFTAENGFQLNGKTINLLGGCVHHDNGLIGAVAPARAEIRKIEILKREGYNAVRGSHNPMSTSFYEACDRLGLLMLDEIFDVWTVHKTPQDYGAEAWHEGRAKDIENWLRSTRNHPSIVIRSLGNEIGNRHNDSSVVVNDLIDLLALARPFDSTRPYTGGTATISDNTDYMKLYDVKGYNYREDVALANHQKFPDWVMIGTESNPGEKAQLATWNFVQENSWFTGCFVWSAFEYIGESWSGWVGLKGEEAGWPSYAAACGLIDITGFPKGGQIYRRVMAGASPIEINVLEPLREGQKYARKGWSWPTEYPSWDWTGFEGKPQQVRVITYAPDVRLKLNGKVVGTGKTSKDHIDVMLQVPYESGDLIAEGLKDGKVICSTKLTTPGKPVALRIVSDRSPITTSDNDLAFVSLEVIDAQGRIVTQDRHPVSITISGNGSLEGCGTGQHQDVYSFKNPEKINTWRGRAIAIVRPNGKPGTITLKAHTAELGDSSLEIPVTSEATKK